MAKRDPDKSARNRIVAKIKVQLRSLLPEVLKDTGQDSEASINAIIGCKNDEFFDLKHDVIPDHTTFITQWIKGLQDSAKVNWRCKEILNWFRTSNAFKTYLALFLQRSYFTHYDELSKLRPHVAEAILWIGQNNADYGLAVTPRFNDDGEWENDKSEIRSFKYGYWTIGHVLATGLVIPGRGKIYSFPDVQAYLTFFTEILVRQSASKYQLELATLYCDFVLKQPDPKSVPLLIPEYRYDGLQKKHKYRLDFLIINPYTMDKVGFELSPWSTHGMLSGTASKSQKQINEIACDNFEREVEKQRSFFKKHNITVLIYSDKSLKDIRSVFESDILPLLTPDVPDGGISFRVMEEFLA